MQVTYNGFNFGLVHLESQSIESVYDDTGKDLLFQRIRLHISGTLNAFMTSSGKDTVNLPAGAYQVEGDRVGIALDSLKDQLQTPRQDLSVRVGPDLVYDCPGLLAGLPCDLEGGPIPGQFRIHELTGDKTVRFSWDITFAVSQCDRYVLSNRWSQSVSIDSEGMAVRTVQGTAIFRTDFLYDEELSPDDFRKWLILPVQRGMRRWSIDVQVPADNSRLSYTVVDRQVGYGIGPHNAKDNSDGSWPFPRFGITRVEGSITAGVVLPQSGFVAWTERLASLGDGLAGRAGGKTAGWLREALRRGRGTIVNFFGSQQIPTLQASVRIHMQPNTTWTLAGGAAIDPKQVMVNLAMQIIANRLEPAGVGAVDTSTAPLLSFTVTQDIGSDNAPYIEVNASYLSLNKVALAALAKPVSAAGLMDMTFRYVVFSDGRVFSPDTSTPTLPNSNNTRGSWLGDLAIAALNPGACTLSTPAGPVRPVGIPSPSPGETGYGIGQVTETASING